VLYHDTDTIARETRNVSTILIGSQLQYTTNELELSYRKQIARQLRTQYVESIYRPKYYTVTLTSRFRSLKIYPTEPLDRSYTTYCWSSYLTLNIIVTLKCGLEVIQGQ